jgi:hypothetical protein
VGGARKLGALLLAIACLATAALAAPAGAAAYGVIAGTVVSGPAEKPLAGIAVCVTDLPYAYEEKVACAGTDAYGQYAIAAPAGNYYVGYAIGDPRYRGHYHEYGPFSMISGPGLVAVAEGQLLRMPVERVDLARGSITGIVAGPGGRLGGIQVCAEAVTATETGETDLACTRSGYEGRFELPQLEADFYRVRFSSPSKYNGATEGLELESGNFVTKYFGGGSAASSATPLWVSAEHSDGGVNVVLQPGATIDGTVSGAGVGALRGVSVCAWGAEYVCGETDRNGNYSIPTLAAGSYKVEFAPQQLAAAPGAPPAARGDFPLIEFARQYWDDKPTFESALPVAIGEGGHVGNIDATLAKEAQPAPPVVPAPKPAPGTAVVGSKANVKGARATLSVTCQGAGACAGTIKLSTRVVTTRKGKNGKPTKHAHTAAIGQTSFSVPAGTTATVAATLNAAGKLLVHEAGAKGVTAKVAGPCVNPGTVKLLAPPAPKKPA